VDVVWRRSQVERKEEVAALLLAHEEELLADFHGGIVLRNCDIAHFKKKQTGWVEEQRAINKKREMFQDILEDGGQNASVGSGKKRKRASKCADADSEIDLVTVKKRTKHK
jgi:hypothetical protein